MCFKSILAYLEIMDFHFFGNFGKDGHRKMMKIRLKNIKMLDMAPISTRKHEWECGSMGPISARKHKWNSGNWGSIQILMVNA